MLGGDPQFGAQGDLEDSSTRSREPSGHHDLVNERFKGTSLNAFRESGFRLTGAIQLTHPLGFCPQEGFRSRDFKDHKTGDPVPGIAASVSAERIVDVLDSLVNIFCPDVVDVAIRVSESGRSPQKFSRMDIDSVVLRNIIADEDFQQMLLNDGRVCFTVVSRSQPIRQIQLDEDKIFNISSEDLDFIEEARAVLERNEIFYRRKLELISDWPQHHSHHWQRGHASSLRRMLEELRGPEDFGSGPQESYG